MCFLHSAINSIVKARSIDLSYPVAQDATVTDKTSSCGALWVLGHHTQRK